MAAKIDPRCDPAEEIARIVGERLAAARARIGDRRQALGERIHRARTTGKKCRAALQLVRAGNERRYRRENRALRDAARDLSELRDADVLLATFDATLRHYGVPRRKFAAMRASLRDARESAAPARADTGRRLRAFGACAGQVQHRLAADAPAGDFATVADGFARCYRRARRALHAVEAQPGATTFHEWRKATKAHYYQCRMLRAAWPEDMKAWGDELKSLADLLGDEHDLTLLRARLRQLARQGRRAADKEARAAVLALVESRRNELRALALPLGDRLFADKPKAVAARLRRWWRVAQDDDAARTAP